MSPANGECPKCGCPIIHKGEIAHLTGPICHCTRVISTDEHRDICPLCGQMYSLHMLDKCPPEHALVHGHAPTIHDVTIDDVIEAMPPASKAAARGWICEPLPTYGPRPNISFPLETVKRFNESLRIVGEFAAKVCGVPIEKLCAFDLMTHENNYDAVVRERDDFRRGFELMKLANNEAKAHVARLEAEVQTWRNNCRSENAINVRLTAELADVTKVKDEHWQTIAKLDTQNSEFADSLEWSLRNEEKQKQYYANKHEDFMKAQARVAELESELEGLKRLSSYANQTYGQQQSNLARFSGEVERLTAELAAMTKEQHAWQTEVLIRRCAYEEIYQENQKLQAENAELRSSESGVHIETFLEERKQLTAAREEIERHISEKQYFVNQRNSAEAERDHVLEENKRLRGALGPTTK